MLMALWIHNYSVYGRRKLWKAARRAGIDSGRDQVARLMRAQGIHGASRAKKRFTTKADPAHTRAPDLVKRNFTANRPDELSEMSLRYGRLFDQTVRAEYERALELAKARIGTLPEGPKRIPVTADGDWRQAPAIKARLAGGYCIRAPAQGACPYANICEHCPSFRTDAASVSVLAAQRIDAAALAKDAEARGWIEEADRHRRLIERLDALMAEGQAG